MPRLPLPPSPRVFEPRWRGGPQASSPRRAAKTTRSWPQAKVPVSTSGRSRSHKDDGDDDRGPLRRPPPSCDHRHHPLLALGSRIIVRPPYWRHRDVRRAVPPRPPPRSHCQERRGCPCPSRVLSRCPAAFYPPHQPMRRRTNLDIVAPLPLHYPLQKPKHVVESRGGRPRTEEATPSP